MANRGWLLADRGSDPYLHGPFGRHRTRREIIAELEMVGKGGTNRP
jgi:hypothetical protein